MQTDLLLETAFQHYERGELSASEAILNQMPDHPSALHLLGVLRVRQGRVHEAVDLLARSVAMRPNEAQSQFNLGKVLAALGRRDEAVVALRAAMTLDPSLLDAAIPLGEALQTLGRASEAIEVYRNFLSQRPGHIVVRYALARALLEAGQGQVGEPILTALLDETVAPRFLTEIHQTLATLHSKLRPDKALQHLNCVRELDDTRMDIHANRAALLEQLHLFEDARAAYEEALGRDPVNSKLHVSYNDLLYRLGDEQNFLSSFDCAPRTEDLMLTKAGFLLNTDRYHQALACYDETLIRYPDSKQAELGKGIVLVKSGRIAEAVAAFEKLIQRHPDSVEAYCNLTGALAQAGDPKKASQTAARALEKEPGNQIALAMQGTCWRLMNDPRHEVLNGYDEFIRIFDLEPPDGFSDMESFNVELGSYLKGMHPPVREYLRQSLRGGTQTVGDLFDAGHGLIEKLQARITEAIGHYIAGLKYDDRHPYLARKRDGFRFSGSWSSRLREGGFHINHLHPNGWISSCYYVELPEVVNDTVKREGWIKFGEPSFEVGLPVRRAIQPVAGRLVLFPSYMWHGTIPFQDRATRTTIAFDVLPC